jgi:hypothetical protein
MTASDTDWVQHGHQCTMQAIDYMWHLIKAGRMLSLPEEVGSPSQCCCFVTCYDLILAALHQGQGLRVAICLA